MCIRDSFRAEELIRFTTVVLAALYALTAAVALHIGRRLNFGAQALFCVCLLYTSRCV